MHYGLSQQSFTTVVSQAQQGDQFARLFLRLACYTTASAIQHSREKSGQFVLTVEQLAHLKTIETSYAALIDELKLDDKQVADLPISLVDAQTPAESTLTLPDKSIGQLTLFTTPAWASDLMSGYYSPSIRFGDLIAAWKSEGMEMSQLTALLSLINLGQGNALLYESHIVNGFGLKSSDVTTDPANPRVKVELISPDDWFSLAHFGAVMPQPPGEEEAQRLTEALLTSDFSAYRDQHSYFFLADVIIGQDSLIRRDFSPAIYHESSNPPFTRSTDCEQHTEVVPAGTAMTMVGKIHLQADELGGKVDNIIHAHGISHEIMDILASTDSATLYQDTDEFNRVNTALMQLSETGKVYCGHLKMESGQCHIQSVEKIYALQALPCIMEISKTGIPPHNLLTGRPLCEETNPEDTIKAQAESTVHKVLAFSLWKTSRELEKVTKPSSDSPAQMASGSGAAGY